MLCIQVDNGFLMKQIALEMRVRYALASLCLCVGVLQIVAHYSYMSPDGLSYLDLSDHVVSGDWHNTISGYWSPAYPLLVGAMRLLLRPTPYWEFTAMHLVNLFAFSLLILCFDRLLVTIYKAAKQEDRTGLVSYLYWLLAGYAVFMWCSISLIQVTRPTPDMLVALVICSASLTTMQLKRGRASTSRFMLLGLILGLGYWIKAALLPIGIMWLLFTLLFHRGDYPRRRGLLATSTAFILITCPLVLLTSIKEHRVTFGESGRLNYAWVLNEVTPFVHWQGEPRGSGTPTHSTRKLLLSPLMFGFKGPLTGTYSPWLEPTFWYSGLTTHLQLEEVFNAEIGNWYYLQSISEYPGSLGIFLMVLTFLFAGYGLSWTRLRIVAPLLVNASAMFGMYSLVAIRPRYISAIIAIGMVSLIVVLRVGTKKHVTAFAPVCAALAFITVGASVIVGDVRLLHLLRKGREPNGEWLISQALQQGGLTSGSAVGSIGYAGFPFWARLARDQVTAEVYDPARLHLDPDGYKDRLLVSAEQWPVVYAVFRAEGVKAVVAKEVNIAPEVRASPGWVHVPQTNAWCFFVRPEMDR